MVLNLKLCPGADIELFSLLRINDDSYGPVIGEAQEHVSAELPGVNRPAQVLREPRDELLV